MIKIRQHLIDPYGRPHVKTKTIKGELFSGETDTNNVEIYENDIVEVAHSHNSQDTFKAKLVFQDGQFLINGDPIESWRSLGYTLTVVGYEK